MTRGAPIAWAVFLVYALTLVAAQVLVVSALWDMRRFDSNLIDFTWQVELPWRALAGEWSGRDFHFPMGPLWQALALVGVAFGGLTAPHVIAGLTAITELGGLGTALWLGRRVKQPWLRLAFVVCVSSLAYGAGIATLRALLSVVHLVLYAPDCDQPEDYSWSAAFRAATVATLLGLLSFDRLVFATLAAGAITAYELVARRRAGQPLRPAWVRAGRYAAAQVAVLGIAAALAGLVGASAFTYVAEQLRLIGSYAVNLASTADPALLRSMAALGLSGLALALVAPLRSQKHWVDGAWICGALPQMGFALVQPNEGHAFMAALPLLVVLFLMASRPEIGSRPRRVAAALVGVTFVLGWFGKRPADLWLHPRSLRTAIAVLEHTARPDTDFVTDLGRAVERSRALVASEPGVACIGYSPALTAVHALANIPGPTSLKLRWNAEQRQEVADAIRRAACPYFMYQMGGFDRPDQPNWFLGEDLIAVAELYELSERVGPATLLLRARHAASPAQVTSLGSPLIDQATELGVGQELSVPLESELVGVDLLRLEYTLESRGLAARVGGAPRLEYRFTGRGQPLSEWVNLFDLSLNHRSHSLLAVQPSVTELGWLMSVGPSMPRAADAIVLRLVPRGRLRPTPSRFVLHRLERVRPRPPAATRERACDAERDLYDEVARGHGLARNVAPRPEDERFQIHSNQPGEHLPEVFLPARPCKDSCFSAVVGIDMPPGSGDGAEFDLHVFDREARPRIVSRDVEPGVEPARVEVSLSRWADRDVLLRFGSLPHATPDNDYLFVHAPRIARCSARTDLADALDEKRAILIRGQLRRSGAELRMAGDFAELGYLLRVVPDTCIGLEATASGAGADDRFSVTLYLEVDGLRLELLVQALDAARPSATVAGLSLHDFEAREVALVARLARVSGQRGSLALHNARIGSCPE